MIVKNKSGRLFTVTDKDYQQVTLHPGETVEVDDLEWKGYLANYSDILEKIDTETEEIKDKFLADVDARIKRLEEVAWVNAAFVGRRATPIVDDESVDGLVAFLKDNGVKNASAKWSIDVLKQKKAKILSNVTDEEAIDEIVADEETPEVAADEVEVTDNQKSLEDRVAEAEAL